MKYELVIFDADETLFDFRKSEKDAFKNTMLEFNINYDEAYHLHKYSDINTAIWKEFEDGLISQKDLKLILCHKYLLERMYVFQHFL